MEFDKESKQRLGKAEREILPALDGSFGFLLCVERTQRIFFYSNILQGCDHGIEVSRLPCFLLSPLGEKVKKIHVTSSHFQPFFGRSATAMRPSHLPFCCGGRWPFCASLCECWPSLPFCHNYSQLSSRFSKIFFLGQDY